MRVTKPAKVGIALLTLIVLLVGVGNLQARREFQALQALLGTNLDPVRFQAESIRLGMSRDEVRALIKGHERMASYPSEASLGQEGTDIFVFGFGPQILGWNNDYGSIVVSYDANGKVKKEAIADLN